MTTIERGHMPDWLSARVKATPDKPFLYIDQESYSFAELDRLVQATCALIRENADISAGDHVGLLLPNGLPFVLSLLALMRLGAVVVPLNTRLQPSELKWQFDNSDCRLLICARESQAMSAGIADDLLPFPEISRLSVPAIAERPRAIDLNVNFAVIHTSGTSGRPKAAILTYGNIFHSAIASAFRLGVSPDDRWLCILPLYHVGGLSIVLRSLLYGTALELMLSPRFDVEAVNHLLRSRPISLISLVPTMLQRLLDARKAAWNQNLRTILLGGEATPTALVRRCLESDIPIATSYGLSEASSQVATATPQLIQAKPASVGKPLLFSELRIIDKDGQTVPAQEVGEILIRGASVMRAYYRDPAATENALKDGWLHTGDIGYLDEDGDLFVLQRRSDLIISGGENVYPVEVETVLRTHPAVAEAVVLGLDDSEWGQRVAAAIQLKPGLHASAEELVAFARHNMASYKVPREIRFVRQFPRTASGKIQRLQVRKAFDE